MGPGGVQGRDSTAGERWNAAAGAGGGGEGHLAGTPSRAGRSGGGRVRRGRAVRRGRSMAGCFPLWCAGAGLQGGAGATGGQPHVGTCVAACSNMMSLNGNVFMCIEILKKIKEAIFKKN